MTTMDHFAEWAPAILAALEQGAAPAAGVVRQALARFAHYDLPLGWSDGDTWILAVPKKLESPNQTIWRHWRVMNRARSDWETLLWLTVAKVRRCASPSAVRALGRQPACAQPMRSTVFRFVASARQFIRDDDNLAFSVKHANDSMKRIGLVKDDNRAWLTVSLPVQDVSPIALTAVTVFILRPAIPTGLLPGATPHVDRPDPAAHRESPPDDRGAEEGRTVSRVRRRTRARAVDV